MNRDIQSLVGILASVQADLPAWEEPIGDVDLQIDRFSDLAESLPRDGFAALASAIDRRRRPLLYRYSVRAASRATVNHDMRRARAALSTAVIAEWDEREPRDLMVNLAPHHVAAARIAGEATAVFDWAADRAPVELAETLRVFGGRRDVTPEAFGWKEVINLHGTWFVLNW